MKVSLILPSIVPELLDRALENIYATAEMEDYEIIVVSPFEVRKPRVVWVPETELRGVIAAHAAAYAVATGDILAALSDDVTWEPGWLARVVDFVESREKLYFPYASGFVVLVDDNRFGIATTMYGYYYPTWTAISRRSVEAIGGYFSTEFYAAFSEADLGLRIWEKGGRCELCPTARLRLIPNRNEEYPVATHGQRRFAADQQTFLAKWSPRLGQNWDKNYLRGFCVDVPQAFIRDNTFTLGVPFAPA